MPPTDDEDRPRRYDGPERRTVHVHSVKSYGHDERALDYLARCIDRIDERLDKGSERMDDMQRELKANTEVTKEVKELLELGRTGFKVLGWLGKAIVVTVRVAGYVGAAAVALYSAWYAITHGGQLPPKT